MAEIGPITLMARGVIPETWDALARTPKYGEMQLQFRVDYVKYSLFATVCDPVVEETLYTQEQVMLAAKKVALEVIPSGCDYWADQSITVNTQRESTTFPDRVASLWRIHARILTEVAELEQRLRTRPKRKMQPPEVNTKGWLRTPDPHSMPVAGPNGEFGNVAPRSGNTQLNDPARTPQAEPQ